MADLRRDIERAINRNSAENGSDTPDFILATYLMSCLAAFDVAVREREQWFGRRADAAMFREQLGAWWAEEFPSEVMPTEALTRLSERLATCSMFNMFNQDESA